jgi:hypothetical protein
LSAGHRNVIETSGQVQGRICFDVVIACLELVESEIPRGVGVDGLVDCPRCGDFNRCMIQATLLAYYAIRIAKGDDGDICLGERNGEGKAIPVREKRLAGQAARAGGRGDIGERGQEPSPESRPAGFCWLIAPSAIFQRRHLPGWRGSGAGLGRRNRQPRHFECVEQMD